VKKYFFIFILFIFVFSCSKNQDKKEANEKTHEKKVDSNEIVYTPKIKIEKINKLNVENFVKIYISRMEQEILWILKMREKSKGKDLIESDQESGDNEMFMKQKKEFEDNFFKSWGITQTEFESFANSNDEKISEYINKNHDLQVIIDEIQKINEKLYNPEDMDDELMTNENNE